jgi:hypothetical protein
MGISPGRVPGFSFHVITSQTVYQPAIQALVEISTTIGLNIAPSSRVGNI